MDRANDKSQTGENDLTLLAVHDDMLGSTLHSWLLDET